MSLYRRALLLRSPAYLHLTETSAHSEMNEKNRCIRELELQDLSSAPQSRDPVTHNPLFKGASVYGPAQINAPEIN